MRSTKASHPPIELMGTLSHSMTTTFIDARDNFNNQVGRDQHFHYGTGNDAILERLDPAKMDPSRRTRCLKGTRSDVLQYAIRWVSTPEPDDDLLWIYGMAGSGKSTITTTLANHFRETGELGAFLFFNKDVEDQSDPTSTVRTMAYQIGTFHPQIGQLISDAIKSTPSILSSPMYFQFKKLLVGPLSSLKDTDTRLVIIIDAIDESGTVEEREALVELLSRTTKHLPFSTVRIIVSSREDMDIRSAFLQYPHIRAYELSLTSSLINDDIASYFRHHLRSIGSQHSRLGANWPGDESIKALTERASGLFVWASTAIKFINGHDPRRRLAALLVQERRSAEAEIALDSLYRTALDTVGLWNDQDFVKDFRAILGTILDLRNPLSSDAFDSLLGNRDGRSCTDTIARLSCVVSASPKVRVVHPSFADFLSSRARCGRDIWYFQREKDNRTLATRCIKRLNAYLKRNMCNMSLSHDLGEEELPEDVEYACLFWVEHVCFVKDEFQPLVILLDFFLHRHLLHWLEAMSILRRSRDTIALLKSLLSWITINAPYRSELHELVHDACRLAQTFAKRIEEHPLLVYFAALPFSPTTSAIYQTYHNPSTIPTISGGFHQRWSPLLFVFSGHGDQVNSVIYSGDGKRIVSGAGDGTVRVWDADSGAEALPPFRGHESAVLSVGLSPDGTKIVSGSWDATVRVWDAQSGAELIEPLRLHTESVLSVAFSPNGTRIISGSGDGTVHVCDASTGQKTLPVMRGHKGAVLSARFTPDGKRIVSISDDKTIMVWNAQTGRPFLPPLRGHTDHVLCFAISLDSTTVVTGSRDTTIRIWDLNTGELLVPPLLGHEGPVWAVGFSPRGRRIVSGSSDKTIRLWNTKSGNEILPPQYGHEGPVLSVKFSPDGTQIATASRDNTVRIWDTNARTEPLMTHKHDDIVHTVAFSPGGGRVVSGSEDTTLKVWDAKTGLEVLPPLCGHQDSIKSATYSTDGTRIISLDANQVIRAWDAHSGVPLPATEDDRILISSPPIRFSTITVQDGWIVDSSTKRTISKIPDIIDLVCFAAHGKAIAVGTQGGRVFVLTFPSEIFKGLETAQIEFHAT